MHGAPKKLQSSRVDEVIAIIKMTNIHMCNFVLYEWFGLDDFITGWDVVFRAFV